MRKHRFTFEAGEEVKWEQTQTEHAPNRGAFHAPSDDWALASSVFGGARSKYWSVVLGPRMKAFLVSNRDVVTLTGDLRLLHRDA